MSRKKFIMLTTIEAFLSTLFIIVGSGSDNKKYVLIGMFIMLVSMLYASYLMIIKKSINLLAGMTEEQAIEIMRDSEKLKKYEKTAQSIGVIIFISSLSLVFLLYTLMR